MSEMIITPVDPPVTFIESSGRWRYEVNGELFVTASREWWEYVPNEYKPHPSATAVQVGAAEQWFWIYPLSAEIERLRDVLFSIRAHMVTQAQDFRKADGYDSERVFAVLGMIRWIDNLRPGAEE